MRNNVTMKDIADALDITVMSVSKALSGKEGVSDDLRAKILAKAEELGYKKASQSTESSLKNIGILITEKRMNANVSYMSLQQALVSTLQQLDYYAITEIISDDTEHLLILPKMIKENKISAFIVLGEMDKAYIELLKKTKLPSLFLNHIYDIETEDGIVSDDLYSGFTLCNYLIDKGFKRIGFVGNREFTEIVMDRYLGVYKALIHRGLTLDEENVICDVDDFGEEIGLFLPDQIPDAFVCNDCRVAYKLIHQLEGMEYDVPKDVSVVAFDDGIFADIGIPKLTTYSIDYNKMAMLAAETIAIKIENPHHKVGKKVIIGSVIERDSVAKKKK